MAHKGFSHIGLSTRDLDSTRDFYENVLGFKVARCDIIKIAEGGQIRHIFFDTGRDQLIAFMEPQEVQGIPENYISLEYCCLTRDVGTEDDVTMQVRVERSIEAMRGRWDRLREAGVAAMSATL